jgi:hypothetical protein
MELVQNKKEIHFDAVFVTVVLSTLAEGCGQKVKQVHDIDLNQIEF